MAPKQSTSSAAGPSGRGRPPTKTKAPAKANAKKRSSRHESEEAAASNENEEVDVQEIGSSEEENDEGLQKTIPPELLTRLLHEFFEKDGTRVTRDANEAVAKYMDVFVREAIARAAAEREGVFLEVEDLEKVAPQLLLDL